MSCSGLTRVRAGTVKTFGLLLSQGWIQACFSWKWTWLYKSFAGLINFFLSVNRQGPLNFVMFIRECQDMHHWGLGTLVEQFSFDNDLFQYNSILCNQWYLFTLLLDAACSHSARCNNEVFKQLKSRQLSLVVSTPPSTDCRLSQAIWIPIQCHASLYSAPAVRVHGHCLKARYGAMLRGVIILLSTLTSVASDLFNYALRLDNELSARPPHGRHGLWTGLKTQMGCLQIVWWNQ